MARFLIPLGIVLLLVAALATTAGVLAYGTEPTRSGELAVTDLDGPVTIAWSDSGHVVIEAQTDADLAAGLGYAHAADHAWAMALWRQAATGTLAEWFGDDARDLDLHARTLGFAQLARQTYESLDPDDRAVLDAYARGANRALAEPSVAQGDAFLVADVEPGAWEPWDALAVERLHLYLAAPELARDSSWAAAARDSTVRAFIHADSTFRALLGMTGGGYDRVYAVGNGRDAVLARQVSAGSSAVPLFAPVTLRSGDREAIVTTIPGTLMTPGGWSGGLGWGLLLGAPLTLERYDGAAPPPIHDRIVERDGDETLLTAARDTSGLVLRPGRAVADSVSSDSVRVVGTGLRVRWRGFREGTDLDAFRTLQAGRVPAAFVLLDGAGLAATSGQTRVLGRPRVAVQGEGFVFVAQDSLARSAANRLDPAWGRPDSLVADTTGLAPSPTALAQDAVSPWAVERLSALLGALGSRDSLADVLQVPYSYLRGWDGAYTSDAIAPSIFEWWLVAHRDFTGHLPDLSDSLDVALLPSTLRIARAELRDRYGPLPSDWRWGTLQGAPSYPILGRRRTAAARRFRAPLGAPGGHPTALRPGPSLVFEDARPGHAVWSVWTRLADGTTSVRAPGMRPLPSGAVDLRDDDGGVLLVLRPPEPLPERRLVLVPPS